jgi:hypothetical protein
MYTSNNRESMNNNHNNKSELRRSLTTVTPNTMEHPVQQINNVNNYKEIERNFSNPSVQNINIPLTNSINPYYNIANNSTQNNDPRNLNQNNPNYNYNYTNYNANLNSSVQHIPNYTNTNLNNPNRNNIELENHPFVNYKGYTNNPLGHSYIYTNNNNNKTNYYQSQFLPKVINTNNVLLQNVNINKDKVNTGTPNSNLKPNDHPLNKETTNMNIPPTSIKPNEHQFSKNNEINNKATPDQSHQINNLRSSITNNTKPLDEFIGIKTNLLPENFQMDNSIKKLDYKFPVKYKTAEYFKLSDNLKKMLATGANELKNNEGKALKQLEAVLYYLTRIEK